MSWLLSFLTLESVILKRHKVHFVISFLQKEMWKTKKGKLKVDKYLHDEETAEKNKCFHS